MAMVIWCECLNVKACVNKEKGLLSYLVRLTFSRGRGRSQSPVVPRAVGIGRHSQERGTFNKSDGIQV